MAGLNWLVTVEVQPTANELFKDRIKQVRVNAALEDKPEQTLFSLEGFLVRQAAPAPSEEES